MVWIAYRERCADLEEIFFTNFLPRYFAKVEWVMTLRKGDEGTQYFSDPDQTPVHVAVANGARLLADTRAVPVLSHQRINEQHEEHEEEDDEEEETESSDDEYESCSASFLQGGSDGKRMKLDRPDYD